MFWADRLAKEIQERYQDSGKTLLIRDEKTMSGRVHIGSMRGVAIHGLVSEALTEIGVANEYRYELNDFDDFDTVPSYLDQERFTPYLGNSLKDVPSPEEGSPNYAEYFGSEFLSVHEKGGFTPTYYRAYADLYQKGLMDECIGIALERAPDVRRILKEVSGSVKDESWYPISVICEKCGKIKTTRVTGYSGGMVDYVCDQSPYGSVACGNASRVSPMGGNAKLFWKVDWAAKWKALGVHVEGAGKDHSTKGGSRDVANHISKELFGYEPPFDIPYEFFLVGGKKMSSSKGRGSSAQEMSELFPPAVFRLVLLGKDINQQIDIDPGGDSVPRTFDWYDDLAEGVRQGGDDDFARLYMLTQLPENQAAVGTPWQLRFSQVAFMVQMPHLSLPEEAARIKGSVLTEEELALLTERAHYARYWLQTYAPEQYKYVLQDSLPESLKLSEVQKKGLATLLSFMEEGEKTGEEIQAKLFDMKESVPVQPKELFSALYRVFLNRESGPKAGWFLSVLPREYLLTRLKEASA